MNHWKTTKRWFSGRIRVLVRTALAEVFNIQPATPPHPGQLVGCVSSVPSPYQGRATELIRKRATSSVPCGLKIAQDRSAGSAEIARRAGIHELQKPVRKPVRSGQNLWSQVSGEPSHRSTMDQSLAPTSQLKDSTSKRLFRLKEDEAGLLGTMDGCSASSYQMKTSSKCRLKTLDS